MGKLYSGKPREDDSLRLVVFSLDEQRYALRLEAVERIVRLVDVTPLPKAPEIVLGVVNVQGRVLPVINIRRRFRLPERKEELSDQMILARTSRRSAALVVDAVGAVVERTEDEVIPAESIVPGTEYIDGVVKLADGLVLIHDLEKFLSLQEEANWAKRSEPTINVRWLARHILLFAQRISRGGNGPAFPEGALA